MTAAGIAKHLQGMLDSAPGITACALVDGSSGLVWYSCGTPTANGEPLWEAAVDYWRLHGRLQTHFSSLGDLGAAVMYHHEGILAVLPCLRQPDLLVVCRADHQAVDWRSWQTNIAALGQEIRGML
jgi:hypothetical protein